MSAHSETTQGYTIQANGLNLYYEEHGQGQPLLLIHGGILTGQSWAPYLDAFTKHFRVITPDSRGHGRTNNPTGVMSFRALAEDMVALIQALGLEKPLIFGYSDGGQVAIEIGMRYPDLAQAIVIGGAYPELTEESRAWIRSILGDEQSPEVDFETFERENAGFAAFLRSAQGDNWKTLMRNIKPMWNAALNYTPQDFARITAPTLVFMGDRDGFVRVEAEFAVIPGSEHTDFVDPTPKVALALPIILDFLLRHSTPKASAD
jgi:pimeloyl-ACP methyl ester carboxylesterase